jgi:1-acyl-sn-glycerol-3-phosphate acyltransferase
MLRLMGVRLRGPLTPPRRAMWLQSACRGVVDSLGIHCVVNGTVPSRGLVVSNHLSYLDIAIYSAAMPCVFVAKAEVRRWPYFGFAARVSGSVFLDRTSRAGAALAAAEIANRLRTDVPVLLFPEGTSTDGAQVLRFHSSLFQPAVLAGSPVTAAAIRYVVRGSATEQDLCWFGDEAFFSHLWRALGAPRFSAEIVFGPPAVYGDRRIAASTTQERVVEMRATQSILAESTATRD